MKGRIFLRTVLCLALAAALLGAAAAEEGQEVLLPDGIHRITVPAEMTRQAPAPDEQDLKDIWLMPPDLELLIFEYELPGTTTQALAEALAETGRDAEVREISGTEFLVCRDTDEADGAKWIGYSWLTGDRVTEISFFCGSQAAADLTRIIMESFRE